MPRLLLSHGYFLDEDEKERQIMKPYPPLGLLYLSSWLKAAGHDVAIYDSTFGSRRELADELARGKPGLLGLYTNLVTRRAVLQMVDVAKRCGWSVVLGGPESANHCAEYLAAGADAIVLGEGELTLTELAALRRPFDADSLSRVAGLAFLGPDGTLVRTPARVAIPDLDAMPLPDRAAIDHGRYLRAWREHHGVGSVNLITARGCPYHCNWCSHAVYGYSHRRRSPVKVADEVERIVADYAPEQLWYADDVFTISHPWLERYADELCRRDLARPFETITRADRLQTPAAAAALRRLGCYRVWIGSESGSQRILDAMDRGVSVEQVRRAIRLAQNEGIRVGMFLMWGYEGEEIEDIAATVEHVKLSNPDVFFTTVSYPIKGTPYFDRVSHKVHLERDWADSTDRDYEIAGRRGRDWYRLADEWLRSEVEAHRRSADDPQRAAELHATARRARDAMVCQDRPATA